MPATDPRQLWIQDDLISSKITLALLAYAAGDAFGVQFEFKPRIPGPIIHQLTPVSGWPLGGVSDDTLLSIMTILSMKQESPEIASADFLDRLRRAIPQLRGLGPTTRAALGLPVKDNEVDQIGKSNGAMMRTAMLGMAFTAHQDQLRRMWVKTLAAATHQNPVAIDCASLLSKVFSIAIETNVAPDIDRIIQEEAHSDLAISEPVKSAISQFAYWVPPKSGVSNYSLESLLAVMYVLCNAKSIRDVYSLSCELGGDTDTIAALSGSLFQALNNSGEDFFELPWVHQVDLDELADFSQAIGVLISKRGSRE